MYFQCNKKNLIHTKHIANALNAVINHLLTLLKMQYKTKHVRITKMRTKLTMEGGIQFEIDVE